MRKQLQIVAQIALLVLFLAAVLPVAAQDTKVPATSGDNQIAARLAEYLQTRSGMGAFSGAVLVEKDGRIIFRRGYGFADFENGKVFTPDTEFEVASISKMFTALAALRLRDAHKLALQDPICRFLSECPETWKQITIDQLIHHQSGIPDYEGALVLGSDRYMEFMTEPQATERIFLEAKAKPLDFAPGSNFAYSNTGYIVLAHVIQAVAGMPFAKFVTENVLSPAGMRHSGVLGVGNAPKNLARGYTHPDPGWDKAIAGVSWKELQLQRRANLALTPPAGDAWLYSTVDDLDRWSLLMDGGHFASPAEIAEIFAPEKGNYADGWFVGQAFGRKRYRHTGSLPGYTSDFIKFPDDHLTIVIFSNVDRSPMVHITRNVTLIALGLPYDKPVRAQVAHLSTEQLRGLLGEYTLPDGTPVIVKDAPKLSLEVKGRYIADLLPLSPTEFYIPLSDGVARFTLDHNGNATTLNVHYSAEDHIAKRLAP